MRLAIMQPYIFPYIGYFQLIAAVDKIVMYDDVNFIKQGWINRNRILLNGKDCLFSVPLVDISSNKKIYQTQIDSTKYSTWVGKFFMTLRQAYKKAPFFEQSFALIEDVLTSSYSNISDLAVSSLKRTSSYIGLPTTFEDSSIIYNNAHLKSQERVIDICLREGAKTYVNASGGEQLYDKNTFCQSGIQLNFIKSKSLVYEQFRNEFVPWLSIIDVMMFNNPEDILGFTSKYELI